MSLCAVFPYSVRASQREGARSLAASHSDALLLVHPFPYTHRLSRWGS